MQRAQTKQTIFLKHLYRWHTMPCPLVSSYYLNHWLFTPHHCCTAACISCFAPFISELSISTWQAQTFAGPAFDVFPQKLSWSCLINYIYHCSDWPALLYMDSSKMPPAPIHLFMIILAKSILSLIIKEFVYDASWPGECRKCDTLLLSLIHLLTTFFMKVRTWAPPPTKVLGTLLATFLYQVWALAASRTLIWFRKPNILLLDRALVEEHIAHSGTNICCILFSCKAP